MNVTKNFTNRIASATCDLEYLLAWKESDRSSGVFAVLLTTIILHSLTFPLTILLNVSVMVAVKTKAQLQTNSNALLACLASTDVSTGVLVQPLYIAMEIMVLVGHKVNEFCTLNAILGYAFYILGAASLYHLVLISGERYFAIKNTFSYATTVSKPRILGGAVVAWFLAIVPSPLSILLPWDLILVASFIFRGVSLFLVFYLNAVVFGEVRRHEKNLIHQQVSVQMKEKLKKEKKGLKTTVRIVASIFLCYLPALIFFSVVPAKGEGFPVYIACVSFILSTSLNVFNSIINPFIYTLGNRQFRTTIIQILLRKDIAQAREIEFRIFGSPNAVGVVGHVSRRQRSVQN